MLKRRWWMSNWKILIGMCVHAGLFSRSLRLVRYLWAEHGKWLCQVAARIQHVQLQLERYFCVLWRTSGISVGHTIVSDLTSNIESLRQFSTKWIISYRNLSQIEETYFDGRILMCFCCWVLNFLSIPFCCNLYLSFVVKFPREEKENLSNRHFTEQTRFIFQQVVFFFCC